MLTALISATGCGSTTVPIARSTPAGAASNATTPTNTGTSSPSASAASGPSPTAPATASPTPLADLLAHLPSAGKPAFTNPDLVTCSSDPGATDPVAVVVQHGASDYVLRDYADEDHPRNLCSFGDGAIPDAIIDPHHLLMTSDGHPSVVVVPSGVIYELSLSVISAAVPANLSQVVWFDTANPEHLHDSWDGSDVVLQQYQQVAGRCGAPDIDSKPIAFSRDDRLAYALWDQNLPATSYLNVVANHQNAFSLAPPSNGWPGGLGPVMAVWSPDDRLFYRQGDDVWSWSQAVGAKDFKPGLRWITPSISPNGKHIAFMSRDANGVATVHLVDPTTGAIGAQIGGAGYDFPYFLTDDLIWVHADIPGCVGGQPTTYVYDLRTATLYPSALDWVLRTWPATSAVGG